MKRLKGQRQEERREKEQEKEPVRCMWSQVQEMQAHYQPMTSYIQRPEDTGNPTTFAEDFPYFQIPMLTGMVILVRFDLARTQTQRPETVVEATRVVFRGKAE